MTALLETEGLQKSFGAVIAAKDISVTARRGERLGLIGNNGAGKTTFVNIVTGYLRPMPGGSCSTAPTSPGLLRAACAGRGSAAPSRSRSFSPA